MKSQHHNLIQQFFFLAPPLGRGVGVRSKRSILFCLSFLTFTLISLSSCTKFLNREPISGLTENNYYQTTDEVETQVIGTYNALQNVYNDEFFLAGLRSDDSYISVADGDINQIDGFIDVPSNSYLDQFWQDSYFAIKQCNTVLKYLNNVTDSTKKSCFEGEAKFMRATMYFNLIRLFGDVPLVTTSVAYNDTASYRRVSKDTVYNQIIADYTVAISQLPPSWNIAQVARATNYAAKGMLAKVYLTQKNYTASMTLLQDLINNPGPNLLMPSYTNIFGIGNEMNPEVMFAVRYLANSNGLGEVFTYNMGKQTGSPGFRSASDFRGKPFVTADSIRKNVTFTVVTIGTSTSYYDGGKYSDTTAPLRDAGNDWIVLRYADVVLMFAEVGNQLYGPNAVIPGTTTTPLAQLNRIRQRANPASAALVYAPTSAAVSTQAAFFTTIEAERRLEFGIEDMRWYDLLRWGNAVAAMNAHFAYRKINTVVQPYQVLFAIPQREIDVSNGTLTQNPGY